MQYGLAGVAHARGTPAIFSQVNLHIPKVVYFCHIKTPKLDQMRSALAFLFALLILVCWMQGFHLQHLGSQGDDPVDPTARELTRQLENALLEGQALRVVDRAFNGRRGWAYPSDFVYSAAIEGDTSYFILHEKAAAEGTFVIVNLPDSEQEMPVRPQSGADHPVWYLAMLDHPACAADLATSYLSLWPTPRPLYSIPAIDLLFPPPESCHFC